MTTPTADSGAPRLYGLPGAEYLHRDPATVVEQWLDDDPLDTEWEPWIIEEWSVLPTRHHMPNAERLLEWVNEWTCENGEVGEDMELDAGKEATAAAEAFLDLLASKVTWCMADKKLRDLHVTPSDDPENPLIDGQAAWGKAAHGSGAREVSA